MSAVLRTQGVEGARVGNESLTYLPTDAKLRMRKDWLAVEPLEWRPSAVIDVVYNGKPLRGTVLAAGPGRYPLKYNGPKGRRSESWESGEREDAVFVPIEVCVGDVVELGGLEIRGYLNRAFHWGLKEVLLVRQEDVAMVHG